MADITVHASVDYLDKVIEFISETMRDAHLDAKQRNSIKIAAEEVFVNIASYAYPTGEGDVTITMSAVPEKITIEFSDCGTPYNPLERDDLDISLLEKEREIGGLGIFMVKKMMDNVSYVYREGLNILTISKNLKQELEF